MILERIPAVSIIIPAFNEDEVLEFLMEDVAAATDGLDVQVIVVDDGSQDATANVARRGGADIVIVHEHTKGLREAIRSGALAATGEIAAVLWADGSYDPGELPQLILPIHRGSVDMVIGSRLVTRSFKACLSVLMSSLFGALTSVLVGKWINDPWSGFRAFKRPLLVKILNDSESNSMLGITFASLKTGARIIEVPVKYRRRNLVGYSRLSSRSIARVFLDNLKLFWRLLRSVGRLSM